MAEIRVQATRVDHWRGIKTEWRSYRTMGDRLGNTVHMRLNLEGPNPHITAWRENRQGVKFGDSLRVDWQGNSGERQNRPDDATMWGAGRSVFIKLSTHANESAGDRDCDEWRYEWQNMRDPWPGEEAGAAIDEMEGAAHAMAPEVGGGGGGGMTEEDIRRILREEAPALVEQINVRLLRRGGQGGDGAATKTIDNIRPKVAAELDEKRVLTVDNVDDATHQFFMDRVYQTFADNVRGFWAWLDNKVNGESAIPTPPPIEPEEPTEGGTPNG